MHIGFGELQNLMWSNAFFTVKKVISICSCVKRDGKASQ